METKKSFVSSTIDADQPFLVLFYLSSYSEANLSLGFFVEFYFLNNSCQGFIIFGGLFKELTFGLINVLYCLFMPIFLIKKKFFGDIG